MNAKLLKIFPSFYEIILKQFVLTLDVERFKMKMAKVTETRTILAKTYASFMYLFTIILFKL